MSDSPVLVIFIIVIACLLFLGVCELLYLDITGLGRRKAVREFPAAAQKFGFSLKKSRSTGQIGLYAGSYNGYHFTVEPDRSATVHLRMKPVPGLEVFITRQGRTNFDSGDPQFDAFFRTRLVSAELGRHLRASSPFVNFAVKFCRRWKGRYDYIQIYPDSIYCAFKYGSGHYIPAPVLEQVIPDMVKLADGLQAAAEQ